jgi:hypothetical protein
VPLRYKFVELTAVTAASLEDTVNQWVGDGWQLDAIRFVTGEQAKRPKMAFVSFVRDDDGEGREIDVPAVSTIRRGRPKIVELGELDLGDAEPFEADLDWASAQKKTKRKKR